MKTTYKHSDIFKIQLEQTSVTPTGFNYKIYYLIDEEILTTDTVKHCIFNKCGCNEFITEVRKQLNTSIKLLLDEDLISIYDIDKLQLANLIIDCLS